MVKSNETVVCPYCAFAHTEADMLEMDWAGWNSCEQCGAEFIVEVGQWFSGFTSLMKDEVDREEVAL
jgi:hypothetical protein